MADLVSWSSTWDTYIRGGVVTESAAMLIRSFLLKTIAATGEHLDENTSSEEDNMKDDPDVPAAKLNAAQFGELLNPYPSDEDEEDEETPGLYGTARSPLLCHEMIRGICTLTITRST